MGTRMLVELLSECLHNVKAAEENVRCWTDTRDSVDLCQVFVCAKDGILNTLIPGHHVTEEQLDVCFIFPRQQRMCHRLPITVLVDDVS